MKVLSLIILILCCIACERMYSNEKEIPFFSRIVTIEYDSCEYVAIGNGGWITVIHKGNCKYCEVRKKMSDFKEPIK